MLRQCQELAPLDSDSLQPLGGPVERKSYMRTNRAYRKSERYLSSVDYFALCKELKCPGGEIA